jgi:hypothetical protein
VIVTTNLRHFPSSALQPFNLEAQHPDDFVLHQLNLEPDLALAAIATQRARLTNPPKSVNEFLESLHRVLPKTTDFLRSRHLYL